MRTGKIFITIGTGIFLIVGGSVFLYFRSNAIRQSVFEKRRSEEIALIQDSAARLLKAENFSGQGEEGREPFYRFWKAVQSPDLLRIKVWDANSTIIWSDLKELKGMGVYDQVEIVKALKNEPSFEITKGKTNHLTERRFGELTELALPFHDEGGTVIGVIEIYRSADSLNEAIQKEFRALVLLVLAGFLVIMAAINFFLFFRVFPRKIPRNSASI